MATSLENVLERTLSILPVTRDDLLVRGITSEVTERIVQLKKARLRLQQRYGSLETLQERVQQGAVPPDDHTLYTDWLEWRAIENELDELLAILGEI